MESAGNFFKRVAAVELLPEEMLFGVQQQITVLAEIVQHEVARAVDGQWLPSELPFAVGQSLRLKS